jgi:hypothetical protein
MNAYKILLSNIESYEEGFGSGARTGGFKAAQNREISRGKIKRSVLVVIDKRCSLIKCRYWGRPEIRWEDVKNWAGLQCRGKR